MGASSALRFFAGLSVSCFLSCALDLLFVADCGTVLNSKESLDEDLFYSACEPAADCRRGKTDSNGAI